MEMSGKRNLLEKKKLELKIGLQNKNFMSVTFVDISGIRDILT